MANLPTQNNNPGDLKNPSTGQFQAYDNPQVGFDALKQDLQGKITGNTRTGLSGKSSLQDFASTWAPDSDGNNSKAYAQKLAAKLGVTTDTPIGSLSNRLDDFASAIADNEGYQGKRVLGSETSAPAAQPESSASQTKPQLTKDQIVQNIDALEKQGAPHDVVQSYLDSLGGSSQSPTQPQTQPTQGTFSQAVQSLPGGTPDPSSGGIGDTVNKLLGNVGSAIAGLVPGVDLATGLGRAINNLTGQPDDLIKESQQSADLNNRLAQKLKDPNVSDDEKAKIKNILENSPDYAANDLQDVSTGNLSNGQIIGSGVGLAASLAAPTVLGKLGGLLGSASELDVAPKLVQKLTSIPADTFGTLSTGEKAQAISQAMEGATVTEKSILSRALGQLQTIADKEAGVGPTALQSGINTAVKGGKKVFKGLIGPALNLATGYGLKDIQDHVLGK